MNKSYNVVCNIAVAKLSTGEIKTIELAEDHVDDNGVLTDEGKQAVQKEMQDESWDKMDVASFAFGTVVRKGDGELIDYLIDNDICVQEIVHEIDEETQGKIDEIVDAVIAEMADAEPEEIDAEIRRRIGEIADVGEN